MENEIRLNKYLADCGICSRREADRLIGDGAVTVDGRGAVTGEKIRPGQEVCVDGRPVRPQKERIVLAVNKPLGVVCTTDKTWGDTTIGEVIRYPKRVFYAGRLDKNSEGLLLMTNDGYLQDRMMRAANAHEKEYVVRVDRQVDAAFLEAMAQGVYLEELRVRTRPCRVKKTGERQFTIILTQGLNRQIRRMCAALGAKVQSIRRVRVMNITLGNLAPGEYRELTEEELAELDRMLEGGGPVRREKQPRTQEETKPRTGEGRPARGRKQPRTQEKAEPRTGESRPARGRKQTGAGGPHTGIEEK